MTKRVLVVDRDPASRMQAIRTLMGAGYEVSIAEDTIQAGIAALEHPDLVVLGDSMTTPAGLELVGRMFSTASTADIPVIVLAGDVDKYDAALRSGARAVLTAPPADGVLLAAVAEHVEIPGALPQAPDSVLNDEHRLAAVAALRPDASEREVLDRFTALASEMLRVPTSTITLLERDRQLVVSQAGGDDAPYSSGETALDYSYCQYAVTSRQPLRISDSSKHPLVRDNRSHTELDVVSYLGIPIITDDDQAVGALCAIDSQPREWTDHDVELLNGLAEILTAHFNTVRATPGRHAPPQP